VATFDLFKGKMLKKQQLFIFDCGSWAKTKTWINAHLRLVAHWLPQEIAAFLRNTRIKMSSKGSARTRTAARRF
jgi:hypothetical protein